MHMNTCVSFKMLPHLGMVLVYSHFCSLYRTYVVIIRDEIVAHFGHILGTFWHLAIFRVRQSGRKKLQG